jgi:hypothetical protein
MSYNLDTFGEEAHDHHPCLVSGKKLINYFFNRKIGRLLGKISIKILDFFSLLFRINFWSAPLQYNSMKSLPPPASPLQCNAKQNASSGGCAALCF